MSYSNGAELSYTPNDENFGKPSLITAGILLIVSFFLPILTRSWTSTEFSFPNLAILFSDERIPFRMRFSAVYPFLMGMAVLFVGGLTSSRFIRSIIVASLGAFHYLLSFTELADMGLQNDFLPSGLEDVTFVVILLLLGLTGILAGNMARQQRSESLPASIIGIVGGGLFLLAMIMPVLPKDAGKVLIMTPIMLFREIESGLQVAFSLFFLLAIVAWVVSAILSIVNTPIQSKTAARNLASTTGVLFTTGFYMLMAALLCICFAPDDGDAIMAIMLGFLKIILMVVGFFLILPTGIAGLAIGKPGEQTSATPANTVSIRLAELANLYQKGAITAEEHEEQKKRILDSL